MAIFRADPSDDDRAAVESAIKARMEAKAKAAAEKQPPAEEKQAAGPADLPITWGKSMRRLSAEEVEAVATYWRNKYAAYNDPEIARLGEEKLAAALTADGYIVPPKRTEPDRLQLLLRRQAAKGNF
jgi:hypothetical protein